jgi:hypothetical protein
MTPTATPTATKARTPKPVREMVALVVLANHLPMPVRITFQGKGTGESGISILSLSFRSVADGQAWSRHLGGRADTHVNDDGRIYLDEGLITWHGWHVQLHASDDPVSGEPLAPAVAAELVAIAGGA